MGTGCRMRFSMGVPRVVEAVFSLRAFLESNWFSSVPFCQFLAVGEYLGRFGAVFLGDVDQFGGVNHRKFLKKQFKELLVSIQYQNMEDQRETLNEKMKSWKGDEYQVDDILIFGVRI